MGVDRNFNKVDEDPETRTASTDAGCPPGAYTLRARVSSAANTELASASAGFGVLEEPTIVVVPPPDEPDSAEAEGDVTLVSNHQAGSSSARTFGSTITRRAQAFTTGSNTGGYNLTSVALRIRAVPSEPAKFTVTIRDASSNDAANPSDTVKYELTNPATFAASSAGSTNTFTAPDNATLSRSTTYFVDVRYSGGAIYPTIYGSNSDDDDSGAAAGWGISHAARFYSTSWKDSANSLRIQVVGSAVSGSGGTNNAPVITAGDTATRSLAENEGAATTTTAANLGAAFTATDADSGATLTYSLEGTDKDSFTLDTGTGQLKTKVGVNYDHEAKSSYTVTVEVSDGTDSDSITVPVSVTDVDEPPSAPGAPTVTATSGSSTSLDVSWGAPTNTGRPDITSYDLQYRQGTTGSFTAGPADQTGKSTKITGLNASTSYEVQVRATNDEGTGDWSTSGSGTTSASTDDGAPGAPKNLTAAAGDTQVVLTWQAPDSDGTSDITRYEHRYRAVSGAFGNWSSVGTALKATVTGLTNGKAYTFEVRAVSASGDGVAASRVTTLPLGSAVGSSKMPTADVLGTTPNFRSGDTHTPPKITVFEVEGTLNLRDMIEEDESGSHREVDSVDWKLSWQFPSPDMTMCLDDTSTNENEGVACSIDGYRITYVDWLTISKANPKPPTATELEAAEWRDFVIGEPKLLNREDEDDDGCIWSYDHDFGASVQSCTWTYQEDKPNGWENYTGRYYRIAPRYYKSNNPDEGDPVWTVVEGPLSDIRSYVKAE